MSETVRASISSLRSKLEKTKIGMLTTLNHDQTLTSRPMTLQSVDADGVLWFFTSEESPLARDIAYQPLINISFARAPDDLYVSVSGRAALLKNREKAQELWNPFVGAFFPRGIDDPSLMLIRVTIQSAEYWDSDASKITLLLHMAAAAITGDRPRDLGEHAIIAF